MTSKPNCRRWRLLRSHNHPEQFPSQSLYIAGRGFIMGWPRITDEEAEQQMLANDLSPLVPYPGSVSPWPSRCLRCGKTVQPTITKVRLRGHQCVYCAGQRIDEEDALVILRSKSMTPSAPYPGASKRWAVHCNNCNRDIEIVLAQVNAGRQCGYCSGHRIDVDDAVTFMLERGLEPLEPYPGDRPWKVRCVARGHEVKPSLKSVRKGHGCRECAIENSRGTRLDVNEVISRLPEFGLVALEPFTNYSTPWLCRCVKCGKETSPTWGRLMHGGKGCTHCSRKLLHIDPVVAVARLTANNLTPKVDFPGASKPWLCTCNLCGNEVKPRYSDLKRQKGCIYCANVATKPEDAVTKMRAVDLEPQVSYPGANKPWECNCLNCGNTVKPHYTSIQQGRRGCRFCAELGIDYTAPGYLYLITSPTLGAHKIGIANFAEAAYEDRVERHIKHGWQPYKATQFDLTETAFQVEQATLRWLRTTRKLPPTLTRTDMPQGGWTETVNAKAIDTETIWRQVLRNKRKAT
jgi:recombinational DNA repair protein (RecF pathway)